MDYHGQNMKITIRPKIFETNSSSLHALSVFTPDIFRDFENGGIAFRLNDDTDKIEIADIGQAKTDIEEEIERIKEWGE